jgi:hypothetical protein
MAKPATSMLVRLSSSKDTTGKGHITKSSGSTPRYTLFVPID